MDRELIPALKQAAAVLAWTPVVAPMVLASTVVLERVNRNRPPLGLALWFVFFAVVFYVGTAAGFAGRVKKMNPAFRQSLAPRFMCAALVVCALLTFMPRPLPAFAPFAALVGTAASFAWTAERAHDLLEATGLAALERLACRTRRACRSCGIVVLAMPAVLIFSLFHGVLAPARRFPWTQFWIAEAIASVPTLYCGVMHVALMSRLARALKGLTPGASAIIIRRQFDASGRRDGADTTNTTSGNATLSPDANT